MSNYVSLARKWRPQQFKDVVGQSNITKTLSQAISKNRVHCGYLFTGSRGIGKTSIARIFAKNLRCENTKILNQTIYSCDECSNCKEIALSTSVDVIEIDGASNNGVDAVREIREGARFLPSSGSRKIYIIDEVHMLTTQAFNALLKTLEEPPPHIAFIFATTEPHKIPATILSRCQRYDFKRPTPHQIKARLEEVLLSENITYDDGAIQLISRAAEGSLRDALSLLDQVIAYASEHISTQNVLDSIGLIQNELIFKFIESVFSRSPNEALVVIENAYNEGHDLKVLTKSVLEHLHTIALIKVGCDPGYLSAYTSEEVSDLKKTAQLRPLEEIELIFQIFHYGLEMLAHSPFPKIILDFLTIKTSLAHGFVSVQKARAPQQNTPPNTNIQKNPPKQQKQKTQDDIKPEQSSSQATHGLDTERPENLISFISQKRPLLASLLEHAYHFEFQATTSTNEKPQLKIYFLPDDEYKKDQLSTPIYLKQLNDFSESFFNQPIELFLEIKNEERKSSFAAAKLRSGEALENKIKTEIENNPIIQEAQNLFGSKIGPIHILQQPSESAIDARET